MLGRIALFVFVVIAVSACSLEPGGAGEACIRSGECQMGLVCIEGMCSDDLDALESQGEVPMLMMDAAAEPEADAASMGAGDAAPAADAAGDPSMSMDPPLTDAGAADAGI